MNAIEIRNPAEAKQILLDALNALDAVSAYSILHRLPGEQLFGIDVCRRLQSLLPKLPSPVYPLLEKSDELSDDEKKTLSPYCYKIKNSADDFDDVLGGLEAHHKQMNTRNLVSKGELIDTIIRGGVSKINRSVAVVLDVIGSLAIWHIREVEARALATRRDHTLANAEDKSNAATEMWHHLSAYNNNADRKQLDARITAGIRWKRFLGEREIGMIVTVHKLPPSLKFKTKLIDKLALVVAVMPGILDRATEAAPCVQKLLDSRLNPWTESRKRQLPVPGVSEPGRKRHRPGNEAESRTPGGSSNSIGALLNAAEQVAAASQRQLLPSVRSSSTPDRTDSSSPESLVPEEIHLLAGEEVHAIAEVLNHHTERGCVDSFPNLDSVSQTSTNPVYQLGGGKETNLGGAEAQVGNMGIVIVAEVDSLEKPLRAYLFGGINKSRMRHREMERQSMRFTDTVRLHLAHRPGEDVKLEIWLCASIGKEILQATTDSTEDMSYKLGDYLCEAMRTSNWWKEEERKGICNFSAAVNVSFPDGQNGSDCKMEVLLCNRMGMELWETAFPVY